MSSPSNLTKIPGIGVYPDPVLVIPRGVHKIDSIITKEVCIGDLNGVNPFTYRRNEGVGFRTVYIGLPETKIVAGMLALDNDWLIKGKFMVLTLPKLEVLNYAANPVPIELVNNFLAQIYKKEAERNDKAL
jgi:hypothetical protein